MGKVRAEVYVVYATHFLSSTMFLHSIKNAAEFFQSYIDMSLDLLSGSSRSIGGGGSLTTEFFQSYVDMSPDRLSGSGKRIGGGGSLAKSDADNLASAYNLLGLALRDSGRDLIATKKAFLAGLSVAPENHALLVNGGVAHQVHGVSLFQQCSVDEGAFMAGKRREIGPGIPSYANYRTFYIQRGNSKS